MSLEPAPLDPTTYHVKNAVSGDVESVNWIVRRLEPLLLANARYRLTGGLSALVEPEDLVQEVWRISLPRLAELEKRDGRMTPVLVRFLSTTLNNQLRSLVARRARRGREEEIVGPSQIVTPETGAATRVRREERHQIVHDAIATLSDAERHLVVLRGIEQHAYDEISLILHEPPNALRTRYGRTLEKLRQRLPGSVFDDFDAA